MCTKAIQISVALFLMLSVSISFAQAPLYKKDNALVGANFNDGPGSSDMTLVMQLSGDGEIYVDEGHEVKFIHDPDNEKVEGWTEIEFDDSKWEDGISGVGFSDNDDNTVTPAGRISIWTRYYFEAPNASKIKELLLLADYDDQFAAWLNGVKIAASSGAPGGDPPAWNASQGGVPNHGSSELAAGKPNKARWNHGGLQKTVVDFKFEGNSPLAVEAMNKLAVTWGNLKGQR